MIIGRGTAIRFEGYNSHHEITAQSVPIYKQRDATFPDPLQQMQLKKSNRFMTGESRTGAALQTFSTTQTIRHSVKEVIRWQKK